MNTQESTRPERLEKSVEIGTLCAFYGGLLTQRQQEMLRLYYEEDFSLGEIAEQFGVSRQNVHELITRSVQKLRRYEAALGGAGRMAATVRQLTQSAYASGGGAGRRFAHGNQTKAGRGRRFGAAGHRPAGRGGEKPWPLRD